MREVQHAWKREDFQEKQTDPDAQLLLQRLPHPFYQFLDNSKEIDFLRETKKKLDYLCDLIEQNNVSCLFFLDKSARPPSWIFREYWHQKYPDKKMPEIRYLNYGREKKGKIFPSDVEQARETFQLPSEGNILVVDEFASSGTSLDSAVSLLQQAFPARKFISHALQMTSFVGFPARYKGVKDDYLGSIVVAPNPTDESRELRAIAKKLVNNFSKSPFRLRLERMISRMKRKIHREK